MSAFTGFILSLALIIASLVTLFVVNRKERDQQEHEAWLRSLVRRCEELENIAQETESLSHDKEVLSAIAQEIVDIYQRVYDEEGQAKHLEMRLSRAKHNLKQYQQGEIRRELCRVRESDASIARAIDLLDQVHEVLSDVSHRGAINDASMDRMMRELEYTRMCVEILSSVAQGHRYYSDEDFISANAHYYHAQKLAGQAKLNDPRRKQLVEEIGELLNRSRHTLSEELMPEVQYNPELKKNANRVRTYADNPDEPPHQQVN